MAITEVTPELDPFLHAFTSKDQIAEVYRAMDLQTISGEVGLRIIQGIDAALTSAAGEDYVATEIASHFSTEPNNLSKEDRIWYEDAILFPNGRPDYAQ